MLRNVDVLFLKGRCASVVGNVILRLFPQSAAFVGKLGVHCHESHILKEGGAHLPLAVCKTLLNIFASLRRRPRSLCALQNTPMFYANFRAHGFEIRQKVD
jgi:hypothetical protein